MPSFATPAAWTGRPVRATVREAGSSLQSIQHHTILWRGIEITVIYTPDYMGPPECRYSHLEIMTTGPRRPLPMTETGYQSLFLPVGALEADGGPVTFVSRWLEHAAKSKQWKTLEADMRQASLF